MRRRPLIGLTAAVLAGTLLGLGFRPSPAFLLFSLVPLWLLLLAALFTGRLLARLPVISLGVIVLSGGLAALAASLAAAPVSPADLRLWLPTQRDARIAVIGLVTGDPSPVQNGDTFSIRFPLQVETVQLQSNAPPRTSRGRLMVTWVKPRPVPPPAYGELWKVEGIVVSTDPVSLRAGPYGARFQARERGHALRQFCEKRRREAWRILSIGITDHPDVSGLLSALTLGTRLQLPAALKQDFMTTGTFHVVAISGLHRSNFKLV